MSGLTPDEQANVLRAIAVLHVRLGSYGKLAKAMRISTRRYGLTNRGEKYAEDILRRLF